MRSSQSAKGHATLRVGQLQVFSDQIRIPIMYHCVKILDPNICLLTLYYRYVHDLQVSSNVLIRH